MSPSTKNEVDTQEAAPIPTFWRLITCEYPPQIGGVSEYTRLLAEGLAAAGDRVEVWCPAAGMRSDSSPVAVHDDFGRFHLGDLWRTGKAMNRFGGTARLLVQWVPHGFGYWSMNLPFCCWLWLRSKRDGDHVEIMVHEPFLPFLPGAWRQNFAAAVHRVMTIILMQAADRVWISIPAWKSYLKPYLLGRDLKFDWLPIPSTIPVQRDPAAVAQIRSQYKGDGPWLLGHFGTYGTSIRRLIESSLPLLFREAPEASWLFIGQGSGEFRDSLRRAWPAWASRIHATGSISPADVSSHLSACDLLIQPYPDGVSSRRSSAMAALSHGKPVLTTSGALTEPDWQASFAVALAPAGDARSLADAALGLLADPDRRNRLGARARQFYQERFEMAQAVRKLRVGNGLC